jgi:hypothetical protein
MISNFHNWHFSQCWPMEMHYLSSYLVFIRELVFNRDLTEEQLISFKIIKNSVSQY